MKKLTTKKNFTAILFTLILSLQCFIMHSALAQEPGTRPPVIPVGAGEELLLPHNTTEPNIEDAFFGIRLPQFTQLVVTITGAVSFLFVIIGGVRLLTAYGSEEKIESGKKTIIYAFVGLIIALLSYAIVAIVSSVQVTQAATLPPPSTILLAQSIEDVTYGGQGSPDFTGRLIPGRVVPEGDEESKTQYVANLPNVKWEEIIGAAIRIILGISASLTLIAMTTAGIFMLIAQGDEDKIKKAKDMILWSLIALAIIAASYGLVVGVTQLQFFQ